MTTNVATFIAAITGLITAITALVAAIQSSRTHRGINRVGKTTNAIKEDTTTIINGGPPSANHN